MFFIFFHSSQINSQCTNSPYGLHPLDNFTTNCNGALEMVTDIAYAGEYSNVVVFPNVQYTFASSRSLDYITITNEDATIIYASGITPINWNSGTNTGIIRYYLHHDSSCQISNTYRTKYIACTSAQPLCYEPQNLGFAGITSSSAQFYWGNVSPTPSQGYQYYISTSSTPPTVTTNPTGSTNGINTTFTGLTTNTTYYCWVRSSCNLTNQSTWIGSSFTTTGGCTTATYGLYPTTSFTPNCTGNTEVIVTDAFAGEYSNVNILSNKQYEFKSSNTNDFITITNATASIVYASGTSPLVWLSGSNSGVLRFYVHMNSSCTSQGTHRTKSISCSNGSCNPPTSISVNTITNEGATLAWLSPSPVPLVGYQYYISTINVAPTLFSSPIYDTNSLSGVLSGLNANTTYYCWVRSNCGTGFSAWISGPSFTTLTTPICDSPTVLNASNVSNYAATINWTSPNPAPNNGFVYYISTSNITPTISTTPTGNTLNSSVTVNGLLANTTYYYWVQSVCSVNNKSIWISSSFTTVSEPLGCTTALYGYSPAATFYPLCIGTEEVITSLAKASQYSKISVLPNMQYLFRSTVNSDFITITNEDASVVYASGLTPLIWNSSSIVEVIRFYNHNDSSCGNQNSDRTKTVICGAVLSSQDAEINEFTIHPNPTSNVLNINTELSSFNYSIYSIEGKMVKQGKVKMNQISIDISNLTSGIYMIELESEGVKSVQKFIKN